MNPDLVLDIQSTFETPRARHHLRQLTAQHKFPLMLQARAAAAVTAIAELVLSQSIQQNSLQVSVFIQNKLNQQSVVIQFMIPVYKTLLSNQGMTEWDLKHACDELVVSQQGEQDLIVMELHSRRIS